MRTSTTANDQSPAASEIPEAAASELSAILGSRFTKKHAIREHHSGDESWHPKALPQAVCFVNNADEVSAVMKICARRQLHVIPYGTGTGLEGGAIAHRGGICIDLSQMNSIVQVNPDDMDCVVQPGVTRKQLNSHLHDSGLFFPVDPGANASLGGMAATRASGTNAVRYGTMRENVLSLKVVTADGKIISTGNRPRKSAAGYDLTRLFVGSEGTLGIIVELTLRLYGRPEAISAARVTFDDVDGAVNTAIQTIQFGIPIARMELMDAAQMAATNRYSATSYAEKTTLLLEFHGSKAGVKEQAETVGGICADLGGSDFTWTDYEEQRREMWDARHSAAYAAMAVRPTADAYATDVCVPISRLADCIRESREDVANSTNLPSFLLGHIGDGNFHYVFLVDRDNAGEFEQVLQISERMVERAIRMGGTCSGEHGVGIGKQKFLELEFGAEAIDVMRAIKRAVDPHDILNPGKLLPQRST